MPEFTVNLDQDQIRDIRILVGAYRELLERAKELGYEDEDPTATEELLTDVRFVADRVLMTLDLAHPIPVPTEAEINQMAAEAADRFRDIPF